MLRSARLKAFAKINLGLRVLHKRPDGYHEIRTIFQTISLADRLAVFFEPAVKTRIELEGAPDVPDNLIARAAHLVLDTLRLKARLHFQLEKIIPMGAGLGGGSSDAAAVLLALPVLAGAILPVDKLHTIALELGSDVPFFLHGGAALGLGRGEELYPLEDRPRTRALVVAPDIHSSTAEAYRDLSARLTTNSLQNKLLSFQQEIWDESGAIAANQPANDFEAVVFMRHPQLRRIRDRLRGAGAAQTAMTGSGSAVFAIFDDDAKLTRARAMFARERAFSVSFLSRAQYRMEWRRALKQHSKGDQWPPQSLYVQ